MSWVAQKGGTGRFGLENSRYSFDAQVYISRSCKQRGTFLCALSISIAHYFQRYEAIFPVCAKDCTSDCTNTIPKTIPQTIPKG